MDRAEVEAILASGRPPHLNGARLAGVDLSGLDLTDADLMYADLTGARLDHALLRGARLFAAVAQGASLVGADLSGANLITADLRGADLSGARFDGADLSGATLDPGALTTEGTAMLQLGDADDGRTVDVATGATVDVALGEGTTGYQWANATSDDETLELESEEFETPRADAAGAFGRRHFRFRVAGSGTIRLELAQPWDRAATPDRTFTATVNAT